MIAHIDMDCFFVAVERLKDPSLRGKPVAVGGDPDRGRSVVTSASYEAREYGVHSAMPMAVALRLCPDLVVAPLDFDLYDQYHFKVKEVLQSFSPLVEMTSIDEGYVDLTGTERLWGDPMGTGERLRWTVKQATRLDCTVGVAQNKLMAKIASNEAKPNGLLHIPPGREELFLAPLPVEIIPGVGEKMSATLRDFGLETVGQIAAAGGSLMEAAFGLYGKYLWRAACGEGGSDLTPEWERKSISKETTFCTDTTDWRYLAAVLHYLTEKVCRRLRQEGKAARTVNVKIRYEDFETLDRSRTLPQPNNRDDALYSVADDLMKKAITRRVGIRLIGVGLSNLTPCYHQVNLFDEGAWLKGRRRLEAVDKTRRRFGFDSVLRGEAVYLINCASSYGMSYAVKGQP
ncbi:MAG: DNA polymerase IV [Candidatus Marinimicrobia bacterium]|nr:DNA polymerase IV [Candidatus Neomarinimicrobiota bacterium]MDP6836574.1 DNA polymerase IV [Candidatus Neomarinimicrobiota bacterium]|tara:strand:- start:890 stop:2095 length:1206 start_codon:yes stop_codon:yes gene_type:complete